MPDTAVVTGAARGIGRAIATRLAHEGWQVVVADLDAAELQAVADELGAVAVPGDTSTDAGVQHLVDTAYGRLGHVDVFFANAGIGPLKELLTLDATLTADEVADAACRALAGDEFYVLPHPEVSGYYAQRAAHPDAWLAGMNRLQQKLDHQTADQQENA